MVLIQFSKEEKCWEICFPCILYEIFVGNVCTHAKYMHVSVLFILLHLLYIIVAWRSTWKYSTYIHVLHPYRDSTDECGFGYAAKAEVMNCRSTLYFSWRDFRACWNHWTERHYSWCLLPRLTGISVVKPGRSRACMYFVIGFIVRTYSVAIIDQCLYFRLFILHYLNL